MSYTTLSFTFKPVACQAHVSEPDADLAVNPLEASCLKLMLVCFKRAAALDFAKRWSQGQAVCSSL